MELKLAGGGGCFRDSSIISVGGSGVLCQRTDVREGHESCVLERAPTVGSRELRQVQQTWTVDSLKMAFDMRWKDLASRLHSIQVKTILCQVELR